MIDTPNTLPANEWGYSYKTETQNSLVGFWFHTFDGERTETKRDVRYQGKVIAQVENGFYLCLLYSFFDGMPTFYYVYPIQDMIHWQFYESDKTMIAEYERLCKLDE